MALEGMIPEMMGERHAAIRTLDGEAAIRAENEIGKPSAIQKEQPVFSVFYIFLKC
jgi:hypothetical protein